MTMPDWMRSSKEAALDQLRLDVLRHQKQEAREREKARKALAEIQKLRRELGI